MWVIRSGTPAAQHTPSLCSRVLTGLQNLKNCTTPAPVRYNGDPILSYMLTHPDASDDEVGRIVGKHRTTIGRKSREYLETGLLVKSPGNK